MSVVDYVQVTVELFFVNDFLRLCHLFDLVESIVMGDGKFVLDRALLCSVKNTIALTAEKAMGNIVTEDALFFSQPVIWR